MKNTLVMKFPPSLLDKPILNEAIKKYELDFNILHAKVQPQGFLIMELSGTDENYLAALKYLKSLGVEVKPLSKDISRDESLCTHCTACVAHCPSKALFIEDKKTMKVSFDPEKCIGCEACIPVCSFKAMSLKI